MRCIIDATDAKDIRTLTCFGVADGSRDPSFVLRHLSEENKEMPKLFCNDFSPAMIDETKKLIGKEFPEIDVGYDVGSASKTDLTGWIKDTGIDENNTIMFIGLYDLDFLRKAMELYKENKIEHIDYKDEKLHNTPIIRRNSRIPCEHTRDQFITTHDGQTVVDLWLIQGESTN